MLKKFVLSNFKNFRDEIKIDFEDIAGYQFSTDCISDNIITKMLIYGKMQPVKPIWEKRLSISFI